ncbi:MAG: hypothetical protein M3063_12425 [Actinomycetota bacterium]|nr:hypothetical protein [Actinomycetota bacterium]
MILIGLLLIIAAVVFGVDVASENMYQVPSPVVFGQSLGITHVEIVFLIGALTGAGMVLGLALVVVGIRHRGARAIRHHRRREEVRAAHDERDAVLTDNEKLQAELHHERRAREREVGPGDEPVVEKPRGRLKRDRGHDRR